MQNASRIRERSATTCRYRRIIVRVTQSARRRWFCDTKSRCQFESGAVDGTNEITWKLSRFISKLFSRHRFLSTFLRISNFFFPLAGTFWRLELLAQLSNTVLVISEIVQVASYILWYDIDKFSWVTRRTNIFEYLLLSLYLIFDYRVWGKSAKLSNNGW